MSTKKKAQLESCKLSFIWGKMRSAVWEAASQITRGDCSKAAGVGWGWGEWLGARSIYKVLVKRKFNTIKHSFYKSFFFFLLVMRI